MNTLTDSRDSSTYLYTKLNTLYWFAENLNLQTDSSETIDTSDGNKKCGRFYPIMEIANVCPDGWRLPTEKEVTQLIKLNKKEKININDTLRIGMCGRIGAGNWTKFGTESTFWLASEVENGHVVHWHQFGENQRVHSHNVVLANRKFPVRCVKNIIQD